MLFKTPQLQLLKETADRRAKNSDVSDALSGGSRVVRRSMCLICMRDRSDGAGAGAHSSAGSGVDPSTPGCR